MKYQSLRSVSDNHVHLICRDGEFDRLPDYVVMRRGEITNLKRTYRLRLANAATRCTG